MRTHPAKYLFENPRDILGWRGGILKYSYYIMFVNTDTTCLKIVFSTRCPQYKRIGALTFLFHKSMSIYKGLTPWIASGAEKTSCHRNSNKDAVGEKQRVQAKLFHSLNDTIICRTRVIHRMYWRRVPQPQQIHTDADLTCSHYSATMRPRRRILSHAREMMVPVVGWLVRFGNESGFGRMFAFWWKNKHVEMHSEKITRVRA